MSASSGAWARWRGCARRAGAACWSEVGRRLAPGQCAPAIDLGQSPRGSTAQSLEDRSVRLTRGPAPALRSAFQSGKQREGLAADQFIGAPLMMAATGTWPGLLVWLR